MCMMAENDPSTSRALCVLFDSERAVATFHWFDWSELSMPHYTAATLSDWNTDSVEVVTKEGMFFHSPTLSESHPLLALNTEVCVAALYARSCVLSVLSGE